MISHLLPLIGTWNGEGVAIYPPEVQTPYRETLTFRPDPNESVIQYEQQAWAVEDDRFLFWEFGFLRPTEDNALDFINTQFNGRVEVLKGKAMTSDNGLTISLESVSFGNDPRMIASKRHFTVSGSTLQYAQRIATQTYPDMFEHLTMTLHKAAAE